MKEPIRNFSNFERAYEALDGDSIAEGAESVSEALAFASMNEGLLDRLRGLIAKVIPGKAMRDARAAIDRYKKVKADTMTEIGQKRTMAFEAGLEADADPSNTAKQKKSREIADRVDRTIKTIESAEEIKMKAITTQLEQLAAKGPNVKAYVDMELARAQEEIANNMIKSAQSYTSPEQMAAIEQAVKSYAPIREISSKIIEVTANREYAARKKDDAKVKEYDNQLGDLRKRLAVAEAKRPKALNISSIIGSEGSKKSEKLPAKQSTKQSVKQPAKQPANSQAVKPITKSKTTPTQETPAPPATATPAAEAPPAEAPPAEAPPAAV